MLNLSCSVWDFKCWGSLFVHFGLSPCCSSEATYFTDPKRCARGQDNALGRSDNAGLVEVEMPI